MIDRRVEVSLGNLAAYGAWALAVALLAVAWITDGQLLGMTAVMVGMVAVTATVRTYFVGLGRRMKAMLIVAATEGPGSVTSMR
jgi:hypothetical protein